MMTAFRPAWATRGSGLYTRQIPKAVTPSVQGVPQGMMTIVGLTKRGIQDRPYLFNNYGEYFDALGGYFSDGYVPITADLFFKNAVAGGSGVGQLCVIPVKRPDAVAAEIIVGESSTEEFGSAASGGTTTDFTGTLDGPIRPSGGVVVTATAASGGATKTITFNSSGVASGNTGSGTNSIDFATGAIEVSFDVAITNGTKPSAAFFEVHGIFECKGLGAWGNDFRIQIAPNVNSFNLSTGLYSLFDVTLLEKTDGSSSYVAREFWSGVSLDDPSSPNYIVSRFNDSTVGSFYYECVNWYDEVPSALKGGTVTGESLGTGDGTNKVTVGATLAQKPVAANTFAVSYATAGGAKAIADDALGGLTGDVDSTYTATINYETGAVVFRTGFVVTNGASVGAAYTYYPPVESVAFDGEGGEDGTSPVTRAQVSAPSLISSKRGIYALKKIQTPFTLLAVPDFAGSVAVSQDLNAFGVENAWVTPILSTPMGYSREATISFRKNLLGIATSQASAFYAKWVRVIDPDDEQRMITVPGFGVVGGAIIRATATGTLGTAPAGVENGNVFGVVGIEGDDWFDDRLSLESEQINFIADNPTVGRVVWGCFTLNTESGGMNYIQHRRIMGFLQKTTDVNFWWTVFRQNNPALWNAIRQSMLGFLSANGSLFAGQTDSEKFEVVVLTQDSNLNYTEVAVAVALAEPNLYTLFTFQIRPAAVSQ